MRINSIGSWGRFPTFQAKVGTGPSAVIVVKRVRDFRVGQWIQFAETHDLTGMLVSSPPRWRGGVIARIDGDRLFLDLL